MKKMREKEVEEKQNGTNYMSLTHNSAICKEVNCQKHDILMT